MKSLLNLPSHCVGAKHPFLRFWRTSWGFVLAGCSGVLWAQQEPATLNPVVVSASHTEQRSFDAPASIQSVGRDVIQNSGPQVNLSESLNRVPGLTILNRQNYAQDLQLSIRGFGARSTFGVRGVRLLIDGIPATTPDGQGQGSSVSLTSTERIEVLRGPLAQLYGNSAGGVIQAFTRDAPAAPEADVQYDAGSFGMHRTDVQLGSRFGTEGLVGLVADYSTFDTNGYRDNSRTERKQFNSKLSFGPDAQTRVQMVVNHFDMPTAQDPIGLTASQLAANPQQAGTNAQSNRVRKTVMQSQWGSTLTHALDANRTVSARVYTGHRENLQYLSSATWVALDRNYYGLGLQYNEQTQWGATPIKWAAGYEFDRSREYRTGGAASAGEKSTTTRQEDNQAENSDLFVQATALLSPRWSAVAGVRSSTVRFVSDDYYLSDNRNGSGNAAYGSISPVLGLTFHAHDHLNLFANYGKGFETPTLSELAYKDSGANALVAEFNPNLNASYSQHFELGAKWMPAPHTRVDAAVFQINTTDEIVVSRSISGQSGYKNAPGTSRAGWELAGQHSWTPHFHGLVSASVLDAKFTQDYSYLSSASTTAMVSNGNKLPGIPQHFVFTELLWTSQPRALLSRSASHRRLGGTQAGLEWVSAGGLYANDTNSASAEGYNTLNFKLNQVWMLEKSRLTAYGRVDNLTDQRYVGSVIVNQSSSQFFEPAPGTQWSIGVRWNVPL